MPNGCPKAIAPPFGTIRKLHHSDRRRVLIFPTERGLDLFHKANNIAKYFEEKIEQNPKNFTQLKERLAKLL